MRNDSDEPGTWAVRGKGSTGAGSQAACSDSRVGANPRAL